MKIERKRYVVMRRSRTEIWCGLAQSFYFKPIDNVGETAIKTYRSETQAKAGYSGYDRDVEIVPVAEIIRTAANADERVAETLFAPVVHGYWIIKEREGFTYSGGQKVFDMFCSECSFCWTETGHKKYFKHCPNCGADMRGGET